MLHTCIVIDKIDTTVKSILLAFLWYIYDSVVVSFGEQDRKITQQGQMNNSDRTWHNFGWFLAGKYGKAAW